MKTTLTVLVLSVLMLGCGEPKITKMNRMHAVNPMGTFYVAGEVKGVGNGVTKFTSGTVEYTDLRLADETGEYTFYFLPTAHSKQPVVGDKVKMGVKFVVLDSSFAGGGRAPIIQEFEFK